MAGSAGRCSALFIGMALLAYPAYLGAARTEVAGDLRHQHRYDQSSALRRAGAPAATRTHGLSRSGGTARSSARLIPMLLRLISKSRPKVAFDAALALVTKRKWTSAIHGPTPARRDGVIEATARTPIMGFRDDVVIRISPLGQGTRVDVRSASRVGTHDLGANASRIRSMLEDIDVVVSSAPEPRQQPQKKTPPSKKGQPDKRQPAKR